MPATPKAGINKNPNINIGFNKMFKKKDNMRAFLYVTVSPSARKNEFKATTSIKRIVP